MRIATVLRRGMAARKTRIATTCVAVAAAVAFLSGSYVLTDTIDASVRQSATRATSGIPVTVTDTRGFGASGLLGAPTLPATLVDQIRAVPGVATAEGVTEGYAMPLDGHGRPTSTLTGIGLSVPADPLLRMVQLDSGTWPAGPDQVVVDAHTASKLHLKPGSTLRVALATGARGFVVTGTIGFGGAGDIAGLSVVGFPSGTAGRLLGTAGAYAAVEAAPAAGLDSAVLQQHQMLRSPRRVAGTTGTLAVSVATVSVATVSVATVSIVAALAAAVSASDAAEVQRSLHADFVVSTSPQATLDTALARRIAAIPGVTGTAAIPCGIVKFPGDSERACGIDPATFERYADLHVTRGSRADLTAGTIAVSALSAARNGWHLGQTVAATFPAGGTENLRVVALFDDEQVASAYLIPAADYAQWFPASLQGDYLILITAAAGKSSPVHAALAVLLSDYPQAFLDDKAGFIHRTVAGIDLLMTMMTGLLALSLLIGLLSLTTSLALSVLERTRETGLLRAIGAEARQIKALIRADAIVAGLLAAAVPARRAARMNVLESLAAQ